MEKNKTAILISTIIAIQIFCMPLWAQMEDNTMKSETPQQRDSRMAWWRQARFGMFVHWGLYSGLAGTWKDKPVGTRGGMEWIQNSVGADTWEYAHEAVPHSGGQPYGEETAVCGSSRNDYFQDQARSAG